MKDTEEKETERRAGFHKGAGAHQRGESGRFQSTKVEMLTSAGRASSPEY